jgi:cardiolipin synthase
MSGERWWNAPNLLTISRLILAPFAIREIVLSHPRSALALLIAAGLTDLLDGLVARATGTSSAFGQLLDPVADKVLLSGVFLGLAWVRAVPVWFVAVVLGRDLLLLAASAIVMRFTDYSDLRPSLMGKGSTVLQILTAGIVVAANAAGSAFLLDLGAFLVWPAAALTFISGLDYGWRGLRYFARVDARSSGE